MQQPLISVLMPIYNVEEFVEEAVYSIINQTYKNLEIIIIDDCSTDNTYNIVHNISTTDSRIKLFKNNSNKGIVDTLNFGLTQVNGTYIVRMDGDDICSLDRISKQYEYLVSHPDIVLVGTLINVIDEKGKVLLYPKLCTESTKIKSYCKYISPVLHIWMTSKEIYDKIGCYRMPGAEDYDFILRILSYGFSINNINEVLYSVRKRNGNTVTASGLRQYKTANYAFELYKERLTHGNNVDEFSIEELNRRIKTNSIRTRLFIISAKMYIKAQKYWLKNKVIAIFYLLISTLFDPIYRISQFYKSFMIRIINLSFASTKMI